MNKILLLGTVNEDMYRYLSECLDNLEPLEPVTLELVSHGGDAEIAIAMCGRIRNAGRRIRIEVYGLANSAAVLVLAAGDERYMSSEAQAMVHESSVKIKGNVTAIRKQLHVLNNEEKHWAKLLEAHTGTPALVWMQLSESETYLTAEECMSLGLIDGILRGALRE